MSKSDKWDDFLHKISEPVGRQIGSVLPGIYEILVYTPFIGSAYLWFLLFTADFNRNLDNSFLEFILFFIGYPVPCVILGGIGKLILCYIGHESKLISNNKAVDFGLRNNGEEITYEYITDK